MSKLNKFNIQKFKILVKNLILSEYNLALVYHSLAVYPVADYPKLSLLTEFMHLPQCLEGQFTSSLDTFLTLISESDYLKKFRFFIYSKIS